ncbi:MAG: hypothetical protein KTR31_19305 [Myxococcales bacterium]|nr:hypothetical protein [Myxococcales bacterium]
MAERLEELQRQAAHYRRTLDALRASEAIDEDTETPLLEQPQSTSAVVPTRTLTTATAGWLALTFLACYTIIPTVLAGLGLGGAAIFAFWSQFPAFILAAGAVTAGVAWLKPRVDLSETAGVDPVFAATLGGFGMWFVLQNVLLGPLILMGGAAALAILLSNVLEMTLIGTMLASFTRNPRTALVMGAGFQFGLFFLSVLIMLLAV